MIQEGKEQGAVLARRLTNRFYLTIALLVLLFLVSGGLLLAFLGHSLDRQAAEKAERLAETALEQLKAADRSHVYDFAFWNDTVAFARGELDRHWADENIGLWLLETYGFAAAFTLGADDSLSYAAVAQEEGGSGAQGDGDLRPQALLGAGLDRLLASARAAPMDDPVAMAAFFRNDDGRVYLAVAAAITPEDPTAAELLPAPRPVLVYARRLDAPLLADLAERFLLPDLRLLEAGTGDSLREPSRRALMGPDGRPVAVVAWTPTRNGLAAPDDTAAPGAVAVLLLLLLAGLLIGTTRHAGQAIAGSFAALEHTNRELALRERAARQARDEAEQASRVKSVFLANVSHELRTPLNAILGFSDVMRHQLKGPIGNNAYRDYAEDIHASGEHLLRLIDNIIDLSRIEVGAWELNPAPTDLRDATEEVLRFLQPLAQQRGLEMTVDLSAAPGVILADRRAISQIVTNLVGNAIKFTDRGGRISVRWWQGDSGSALFGVADTGVGIATADLETIILPFERGRDPATRRREGSGLGLAIVKSLVDLHGGSLDIDSSPGEGTRVTVVLPGRAEAAVA